MSVYSGLWFRSNFQTHNSNDNRTRHRSENDLNNRPRRTHICIEYRRFLHDMGLSIALRAYSNGTTHTYMQLRMRVSSCCVANPAYILTKRDLLKWLLLCACACGFLHVECRPTWWRWWSGYVADVDEDEPASEVKCGRFFRLGEPHRKARVFAMLYRVDRTGSSVRIMNGRVYFRLSCLYAYSYVCHFPPHQYAIMVY